MFSFFRSGGLDILDQDEGGRQAKAEAGLQMLSMKGSGTARVMLLDPSKSWVFAQLGMFNSFKDLQSDSGSIARVSLLGQRTRRSKAQRGETVSG